MIVNDIVANLQFPLIKAYQVTEKQPSTQCQWKDKVNKHLWIIQACLWKKMTASFKVAEQLSEQRVHTSD